MAELRRSPSTEASRVPRNQSLTPHGNDSAGSVATLGGALDREGCHAIREGYAEEAIAFPPDAEIEVRAS